jgi:hydrogenase nickel incorporation protein HypA/HybF
MHEGSITKSLLALAEKSRKEEDLKEVTRVKIVVGVLHHIIQEVMLMHFDLMKIDHRGFEEAVLEIEERQIKLRCSECCATIELQQAVFICPECHSTETEVIEGNELYIESITGIR